MKNEKKFLYALTKREAHAALDACNRITADSPENLGISNCQFEACVRAAHGLARPAIDGRKILLALTRYEFQELHLSLKCGESQFTGKYSQKGGQKSALGRVQKMMPERYLKLFQSSKRTD